MPPCIVDGPNYDGMTGDDKQATYGKIFAELRKYYTQEQIAALGWKTGIWLGYGFACARGRRLMRYSSQSRVRPAIFIRVTN